MAAGGDAAPCSACPVAPSFFLPPNTASVTGPTGLSTGVVVSRITPSIPSMPSTLTPSTAPLGLSQAASAALASVVGPGDAGVGPRNRVSSASCAATYDGCTG